ncbi:MAG TPA: hypothetical protein PK052_05285 [Anaerohalosphaeraceae bacterium]|nr:hypothetical protein [Anaerohalosphaeraceae bacterium]HOL31377.1 hypothetical protein [Anaerohalosphaeraceae bacterium]HOM76325.1 hypothetical protein [Anaerohalosphaeraceae bacterium]HPC64042.1 hypothetical protein [Anaerohalosphaeraceae bacterium]HPO70276.1 hypothetical protein [Anaerohalosphaeraceae bacterium]
MTIRRADVTSSRAGGTDRQPLKASLRHRAPQSRRWLRWYLGRYLNYRVPAVRVCAGHSSPMDYLWHAYSADGWRRQPDSGQGCSGDCIVWANRGGGKTQLAAAATLLEGLFKPHCRTLILAGSRQQSGRMYDYLCEFVQRGFSDYLDGRMLADGCRFVNGATVQVLAQSAASVRGLHVHKLRCDEVELFDPEVLAAANFVTHSSRQLTAAMELLSTMHRPYGPMQTLIDTAAGRRIPVFRWCVWEVIEQCRPERSCSRCPLNSDCGGKARQARGYLKIDDVISQMRRSSRAVFESEMLCLRPNLEKAVFAEFNPAVHVRPAGYDAGLPLYRSLDFGFVNPFVCLWIQTDGSGVVRVIDEYVQSRRLIGEHAQAIRRRTPCEESQVVMTFCDPAGSGCNDVTGTSAVRELKALGFRLKYRASRIYEGIGLIRSALRAGDGQSRLVIDPRCRRLIEALLCYHYPDAASETPCKDGIYDHPIDALRYFFVNYYADSKSLIRPY